MLLYLEHHHRHRSARKHVADYEFRNDTRKDIRRVETWLLRHDLLQSNLSVSDRLDHAWLGENGTQRDILVHLGDHAPTGIKYTYANRQPAPGTLKVNDPPGR